MFRFAGTIFLITTVFFLICYLTRIYYAATGRKLPGSEDPTVRAQAGYDEPFEEPGEKGGAMPSRAEIAP